ncbi:MULTISPECIES: (2Fe-2S)-binding protein [unclassified Streptomyces]|uniref:(2Fe-2S)-binding protein n=1 Tax=unclassified Streptomyces TaxID=2593676 RepID=UPI002E2CDA19|nr:(2Fe-2S)-binding protein [Streptomyces sp. NBC_00223]
MYVCSCFGITEQQVKQHAEDGRCTPREIASACKAGTDCGSCVKRIQSLLGRGAGSAPRTRRVAAETVPAGPALTTAGASASLAAVLAEAPAPTPARLPAEAPARAA